MLNDNLAIVVVFQDASGEPVVNSANGDDVKSYIDELIRSAVSKGLSSDAMFLFGYLAAMDAIAGGQITFDNPNLDLACAYSDALGKWHTGEPMVTDAFRTIANNMMNER